MLNFYDWHNNSEELDNQKLYDFPISDMKAIRNGNPHADYSNILHLIKKSPEHACWYAQMYIKGRWIEAEEYIMKDPLYTTMYAIWVIKGRWEDAEPIIKQSKYWKDYCMKMELIYNSHFWKN